MKIKDLGYVDETFVRNFMGVNPYYYGLWRALEMAADDPGIVRIMIPTPITLSKSVIASDNVHFYITRSGYIDIPEGVSLTINGEVISDGGTIKEGSGSIIYGSEAKIVDLSEVVTSDTEISVEKGLLIADYVPAVTTNKLYNNGGNLFFDDVNISEGGGGGSSANLLQTTKIVDNEIGILDASAILSDDGYKYDYLVTDGTNVRAGSILMAWELDSLEASFSEIATNPIGDTSDVIFTVDVASGFARLICTTTGTYTVKLNRYSF